MNSGKKTVVWAWKGDDDW